MQRIMHHVGLGAVTRHGAVMAMLPALLAAGCAEDSHEAEPTVLRVVSYPWIPDSGEDQFAALTAFIEQDFESRYPDIDLQLRPVIDSFGVYELEAEDGGPGALINWLTNQPVSSEQHGADDGYHLVEIDTLILGDLTERQLISSWTDIDTSDWHESGRLAVTMGDALYGAPRLLCSHFAISRELSVTAAATVQELMTALDALPPDRRALSGNFAGSWNSPALYIDAWHDTYPDAPVAEVFGPDPGLTALDEDVMVDLAALTERCSFNDANPCIDGTYDDYTDPNRAAVEFARGEAHATFGYSERLHYIIKESQARGVGVDDLDISLLPLGAGNEPILFADAFVMRKDCDAACRAAATTFVQYMNAPETHEAIMLSRDSGAGLVPRYVIPASTRALTDTELASDPFYAAIRDAIQGGVAFPNQGFYARKGEVDCALRASWGLGQCP